MWDLTWKGHFLVLYCQEELLFVLFQNRPLKRVELGGRSLNRRGCSRYSPLMGFLPRVWRWKERCKLRWFLGPIKGGCFLLTNFKIAFVLGIISLGVGWSLLGVVFVVIMWIRHLAFMLCNITLFVWYDIFSVVRLAVSPPSECWPFFHVFLRARF